MQGGPGLDVEDVEDGFRGGFLEKKRGGTAPGSQEVTLTSRTSAYGGGGCLESPTTDSSCSGPGPPTKRMGRRGGVMETLPREEGRPASGRKMTQKGREGLSEEACACCHASWQLSAKKE